MIRKLPMSIIPKNVMNSYILLTGACPATYHLVAKYTSCNTKPIVVRLMPILEKIFFVDFTDKPNGIMAIKYAKNEI